MRFYFYIKNSDNTFMATKLLSILAILLILTSASIAQDQASASEDIQTLRIAGSSTVSNFLMTPDYVDDLSKRININLLVNTNSSGKGVLNLVGGFADIAMISSDFQKIIEKLNQNEEVNINIEEYQIHKIEESEVEFIVHKDNPINKINKKQAKELLTGKITKWDQLNIKNLGHVKVSTESEAGGLFTTVLSQVTDKEPIIKERIVMQQAPNVAIVISQLPSGFGFISSATPIPLKEKVKILHEETGFVPTQKMYFVTKANDNNPKIKTFLETVKADIAQ